MRIIEITENKVDKLADHIEDALSCMGKAMHCVEELREDAMNERRGYRREEGIYGERRGNMRMREDDEYMIGERRVYRR